MDTIRRPGIVVLQPLVNDERQLQLIRLADRPNKRVIIIHTLEHLHPIQHVSGVRVYRLVIKSDNSFVDPHIVFQVLPISNTIAKWRFNAETAKYAEIKSI